MKYQVNGWVIVDEVDGERVVVDDGYMKCVYNSRSFARDELKKFKEMKGVTTKARIELLKEMITTIEIVNKGGTRWQTQS
jgi:hypothetical protein